MVGDEVERPEVGSSAWWDAQATRREPLSAGRIVEAAIRVIEAEGGDALSMRRLASELGVAVASLYRHVESRDALLLLVGEAILADVELPDDPAASWQERSATYAYAVRRALGRHPGRATFVLGPDTPAPEAFSLFQRGLQVYLDAGFPEDLALASVQAIVFLVLNYVAAEAEFPRSISVPSGVLVPAGDEPFPHARRVDGAESERPTDEMFDFLLAATIAAIERRAAPAG